MRMGWAQQTPDVQATWLAEATCLVLQAHVHVDAAFLDGAPNLMLLATPSVGFDNIDAVECGRRGIYVTNGAGSITETTADLALCLLLGCMRHLGANHMIVKGGPEAHGNKWFIGEQLGDDPTNKILGVVGFGRIGQALAQKCRAAFNMEVIFYDAFHVQSAVVGARKVGSLEELLRTADVVSVNSVLDASTLGAFSHEQFAMMKKGAYLINAARGPLIDEDALAAVRAHACHMRRRCRLINQFQLSGRLTGTFCSACARIMHG
eukprot:SAG31_NODE_6448_length_2014_cov_51.121155_3_plen_264_part_00